MLLSHTIETAKILPDGRKYRIHCQPNYQTATANESQMLGENHGRTNDHGIFQLVSEWWCLSYEEDSHSSDSFWAIVRLETPRHALTRIAGRQFRVPATFLAHNFYPLGIGYAYANWLTPKNS